jgi:MOSC domain-containing protein YiiM
MKADTPQAYIYQISISKGGVPKKAVPEAELGELGLVGDLHRHTKFHGGSSRALCLYSLERIQTLQQEGHPIFPGAMGENLTLSGLDWDLLQPGRQLRFGQDVLVKITSFTTPCKHIAPYFRDGKMDRVLQTKYPGWSRVYARVLAPGELRTGDKVFLLPL